MLSDRSYVQGTRYYPSPDVCLGFIGRLLRSSNDVHLQTTLGPLLESRLPERLGLGGSALDLAMRITTCSQMGIACEQDRQALLSLQCEEETPEARKDDSYCVPGTGDPDGLIPSKWFHGSSTEAMNHLLEQDLDILVMCFPLTGETRGMISYQQFEIMSKKKTWVFSTLNILHLSDKFRFLSSVARGESINTGALIHALETGQIRGAAVDGTDPEPLPSDHPLWKAPNLLVTP